MKKAAIVLSGSITYIILALLFSSYGNIKNHQSLNSVIVDRFLEYVKTNNAFKAFKNYTFDFSGDKLFGDAIVKRGTNYAEGDRRGFTPKDWIVHGGFSADEPELPASFRHFYDPTREPGDHYLHDHINDLDLIAWNYSNPRIDQIEWATTHSGHDYRWDQGIKAVENAVNEFDIEKEKDNMAFAWRALGETLHMIADMGCPAHVRDDSHPAPFGHKGIMSYLGSPDPYEELCEAKFNQKDVESLSGRKYQDIALQESFEKATNVRTIAQNLAAWTNKNFFTSQTIYGPGVKPLIHPIRYYKEPTLASCEYDEVNYQYTKEIAGEKIIMCSDKDYLVGKFWKQRGYPKFEYLAISSQASIIFPQIIEAGIYTMRLMIPVVEVRLNQVTESDVAGKVIHKTNAIYTNALAYDGYVTIYHARTNQKIGSLMVTNGEFEGPLDLKRYTESDTFYGEIDLGGIRIKSDPKPLSIPKDQWEFAYQCHIWGITSFNGADIFPSQIAFNNVIHPVLVDAGDGHCSASFSFDDPITFLDVKAEGNISFDFDDGGISNLEVNMSWHKLSTDYRQTESFSINYVPLTNLDGKLGTYSKSGHNLITTRACEQSTQNTDILKYEGPDPNPLLEDRIAESILLYLRRAH